MRLKDTLVLLMAFGVCMNVCQAIDKRNIIEALQVVFNITSWVETGLKRALLVVSAIKNLSAELLIILEHHQTTVASTNYTAVPYVFLTDADEFEDATYKSDPIPLVLNKNVDVWPDTTTSISGHIELTPELCSDMSNYTHMCVVFQTTDETAEEMLDNDACTLFDGCTTSGATSANIVGWYVIIPLTMAAVGWFGK